MGNIKEVEGDKAREAESKKNAEIKMLEKMMEGLKRDKKEMEERIEDIITRHDLIDSKNSEEHHNTVKYFESIVS